MDVLTSYFFARLLDQELLKIDTYDKVHIENAIRGAERQLLDFDMNKISDGLK
jgi:hypothetical protein